MWSVVARFAARPLTRLLAVGLAVTASVLAGCGDAGPPDAFEERTPLPDCGRVEVEHDVPAGPAVDCFHGALSEGRDAELLVRAHTVEGDPVDTYYRTMPDRRGI